MFKIHLINGLYKSTSNQSSLVAATKFYKDGDTMFEVILIKCSDPNGCSHVVRHHSGIDRSWSSIISGKVVQRFGEKGFKEMRVKSITIQDHSPSNMKDPNMDILVREFP